MYNLTPNLVFTALEFNTRYSDITQTTPPITFILASPRKSQPAPFLLQTGNSAPLTDTPALSTAIPIYGPMTGIFLAKPAIVPKKSPNRINIPYNSTKKPVSGHRRRMRTRPPKNAAVPLSFCRRAKKRSVFWGPIMIVRPIRKRICDGALSDGLPRRQWDRRKRTYVAHCKPGENY